MKVLSGLRIFVGVYCDGEKDADRRKDLKRSIKKLGAVVTNSIGDADCGVFAGAPDALLAMASMKGVPAVQPSWVQACKEAERMLPYTRFPIQADTSKKDDPLGSSPTAAKELAARANKDQPESHVGAAAAPQQGEEISLPPPPRRPAKTVQKAPAGGKAASRTSGGPQGSKEEGKQQPTGGDQTPDKRSAGGDAALGAHAVDSPPSAGRQAKRNPAVESTAAVAAAAPELHQPIDEEEVAPNTPDGIFTRYNVPGAAKKLVFAAVGSCGERDFAIDILGGLGATHYDGDGSVGAARTKRICVVVADNSASANRSMLLAHAVTRGLPIVTYEWAMACMSAGEFADPAAYMHKRFNDSATRSKNMLRGMQIRVIGDSPVSPTKDDVMPLLNHMGARPVLTTYTNTNLRLLLTPMQHMTTRDVQDISSAEDSDAPLVSASWLLDCLAHLKQPTTLEKYTIAGNEVRQAAEDHQLGQLREVADESSDDSGAGGSDDDVVYYARPRRTTAAKAPAPKARVVAEKPKKGAGAKRQRSQSPSDELSSSDDSSDSERSAVRGGRKPTSPPVAVGAVEKKSASSTRRPAKKTTTAVEKKKPVAEQRKQPERTPRQPSPEKQHPADSPSDVSPSPEEELFQPPPRRTKKEPAGTPKKEAVVVDAVVPSAKNPPTPEKTQGGATKLLDPKMSLSRRPGGKASSKQAGRKGADGFGFKPPQRVAVKPSPPTPAAAGVASDGKPVPRMLVDDDSDNDDVAMLLGGSATAAEVANDKTANPTTPVRHTAEKGQMEEDTLLPPSDRSSSKRRRSSKRH